MGKEVLRLSEENSVLAEEKAKMHLTKEDREMIETHKEKMVNKAEMLEHHQNRLAEFRAEVSQVEICEDFRSFAHKERTHINVKEKLDELKALK